MTHADRKTPRAGDAALKPGDRVHVSSGEVLREWRDRVGTVVVVSEHETRVLLDETPTRDEALVWMRHHHLMRLAPPAEPQEKAGPDVVCTQVDAYGVICECCERRKRGIETDFGVLAAVAAEAEARGRKVARWRLADAAGTSESHLAKVEAGEASCSLFLASRIAEALDVTIDEVAPILVRGAAE